MLTLDFINVGYGDAALIREQESGEEFSMLVDCGDWTTGKSEGESCRVLAADYLGRLGIRRLDLLVLTHLHLDHSGGLTALLDQTEVGAFWTNYLPPERYWSETLAIPETYSAGARCLLRSMNIYLQALTQMKAQGTDIRCIRASQASVDLTGALRADVFLEEESLHRRQHQIWQDALAGKADGAEMEELDRFINNTSIRLRLRYGGRNVELPGDVYADCWEKHALTPCAIAKLPHHGHRDAVTPHLLEMLRPEHSVISVSNTRTDDCPSRETVRAVRESGSRVYFTDAVALDGACAPCRAAVRFQIDSDGSLHAE